MNNEKEFEQKLICYLENKIKEEFSKWGGNCRFNNEKGLMELQISINIQEILDLIKGDYNETIETRKNENETKDKLKSQPKKELI